VGAWVGAGFFSGVGTFDAGATGTLGGADGVSGTAAGDGTAPPAEALDVSVDVSVPAGEEDHEEGVEPFS
jgi:hypothetical protein